VKVKRFLLNFGIFSKKGFSFDKNQTNMIWQLICGWIIYFFVHSLMASIRVKNYFSSNWPRIFTYYRIIYNVIAIVGLGFLLVISFHQSPQITQPILGGIISFIGFVLLILAFRSFNLSEFFGFKSEAISELVVTGMYQYVRHPLYFGTMIFIAGLYLLIPSDIMLSILVISYLYIWIGSRLEERKLRALYGESYVTYAKKVKSLIPYVY
jgi:protein-S-isoprenylcysteine O-methyltransferase Ste14